MTSASHNNQLVRFLDRHMVVALLSFQSELESPAKDSYKEGLNAVLGQTNLFDRQRSQLTGKALAELNEKQQRVERKADQLRTAAGRLVTDFFDVDATTKRMKMKLFRRQVDDAISKWEKEDLPTRVNLTSSLELAQLVNDLGFYREAADLLFVLQRVSRASAASDDDLERQILWGRLLNDTLADEWSEVLGDIRALRDALEPDEASPRELTWLLHWSLFYYFKKTPAHDSGALLDHISSIDRSDSRDRDYNRERQKFLYGNVIQSVAPHLMRYVAVAAILNKKKRTYVRRVAKMCELETSSTDPFVRFVEHLCSDSDSRAASALLPALEESLSTDFFLVSVKDAVMNAARMMIFEESLRIHKAVSIPAAATRLGMSVDKTEAWIVDVIADDAKCDATIDSVNQMVNVSNHRKSVWRQVLDILEPATRHATATSAV